MVIPLLFISMFSYRSGDGEAGGAMLADCYYGDENMVHFQSLDVNLKLRECFPRLFTSMLICARFTVSSFRDSR